MQDEFSAYANDGDEAFTAFMRRVNRVITARLGMGVFDFADAMWRDLFDGSDEISDDEILETLAEADDIAAAMLAIEE